MPIVEWECDGPVGIATMNDPQRRNALSSELRDGMRRCFDEFAGRDDLRVMIITGTGTAFCAGGDLSDMPEDVKHAKLFLADVMTWLTTPERLNKPVIAAVNGLALGGGLELAMACDMVVASDEAQFGVPEALVGLAPGFAIVRLHDRVGPPLAKEMAFTGRRLSAREALDHGLVNRVVPAKELLAEARALATSVLAAAPLSVELIKSAMNRELGGADLTYAVDAMTHLFATKDITEGMDAFRNKRTPHFTGS